MKDVKDVMNTNQEGMKGRKILFKSTGQVWTIIRNAVKDSYPDELFYPAYYAGVEKDGNIINKAYFREAEFIDKRAQILNEGPFDASKLFIGDKAWCQDHPYLEDGWIELIALSDGYHRFRGEKKPNSLSKEWHFTKDGGEAISPLHKCLYFYPPSLIKKDLFDSLEAGIRVLDVVEKYVYKLDKKHDNYFSCTDETRNMSGGVWSRADVNKELNSRYVILKEGPFDGYKAAILDWVYVEGCHVLKDGWYSVDCVDCCNEKGTVRVGGWYFLPDGRYSSMPVNKYPITLFNQPPKDVPYKPDDALIKEIAKDNKLVNWCKANINNPLPGCPHGGACLHEDSVCYKLFKKQGGSCPCGSVGVGPVHEMMRKIINVAEEENILHVGDSIVLHDGSYTLTVTENGLKHTYPNMNRGRSGKIVMIGKDFPTNYDGVDREYLIKNYGLNDLFIKMDDNGEHIFVMKDQVKKA